MATAKKAASKAAPAVKAAAPKVPRSVYLAGAAANRAVKAVSSLDGSIAKLAAAKTEKQRNVALAACEKKAEALRGDLNKIAALAADAS